MSKRTILGSEYQYGETIDKCLTDLAIKVGTGVVIGGVFSLLFSRRKWPVIMGSGVGIGMAYTSCENRLRFPELYKTEVQQMSKPSDLPVEPLSSSDSKTDVSS